MLTKPALLEAIDFELRRLESSQRQNGWTPWLLWATGAALVWQGLGQWEKVTQWNHVLTYWSMALLSGDFVAGSVRMSRQRVALERRSSTRYYSSTELLSATRPYLAFAGTTVALAAVWVYQSGILPFPWRWLWALFYGTSLLGTLVLLLSTLVEWPLLAGVSAASWSRWIVQAFTWTFQAAGLGVMFWGFAGSGVLLLDTEAGRMAAILFALTYVFSWQLAFPVSEPVSTRLVQIRRALALDELSVDEAKSRFDVVLHGEEQTAVLRKRVESCLVALEEFSHAAEGAEAVCAATRNAIALPTQLTEARRQDLLKALALQLKTVTKAFGKAESRHTSFETRALLVATLSGNQADLEPLRTGLKKQISEAETRRTVVIRDLDELSLTVEQTSAAHRRAI